MSTFAEVMALRVQLKASEAQVTHLGAKKAALEAALRMWDDAYQIHRRVFFEKYPWFKSWNYEDLMVAFTRAALATLEGE